MPAKKRSKKQKTETGSSTTVTSYVDFFALLSPELVCIIGKLAVGWVGDSRPEVQQLSLPYENFGRMRMLNKVFASVMHPSQLLWVFEHNFIRAHLSFLKAKKAAVLKLDQHDAETGHAPDSSLEGEDFIDSMRTRVEEMRIIFLKKGGLTAVYHANAEMILSIYKQFRKCHNKENVQGCKTLIETMRTIRASDNVVGMFDRITNEGVFFPDNYDGADVTV